MNESRARNRTTELVAIVVLFFLFGGLIGASAYVAFLPAKFRLSLKIAMVLIGFLGWLALSRVEQFEPYRQIVLSFFSVSLGVLLSHDLGGPLSRLFGFSIATVQGVAIAKFSETLPIVGSILVLHFATGDDLEGLFL